MLGRNATPAEVSGDVDRWFWLGGQAGIARELLRSPENAGRMLQPGGVALPDMVAVGQLQQILLAAYNEQPDGFVNLLNRYLQADPSGHLCASQQVCNTALYELIKNGGISRGIPDHSVQVSPVTADASTLVPTQNEVGVDNSLSYPLTHVATLSQYLQGGTLIPGSVILTANGGTHIVDGHHRWSSVYVISPYAQISAVDLGYVPDPHDALKETQIAIAAQLGYLPVQHVQGSNLFTVERAQFDADVERLIKGGSDPAAVMKVFADVKGLKDMSAVQNYLWANVERMRQFNQPIAGATGRGYVPQPPELQTTLHLLEGGGVIYTLPVVAYLG